MRFLLLNQTFYPDVAATAQYLADVAQHAAKEGHRVEVITSRRAYDNPQNRFASREHWNGVYIRRVFSSSFGKKAKWRRALDFASFMISCSLRMLFVRRPDVVVALTSPPLISFVAALFAGLSRCRFIYWVMDLNPDEAVAAGWLKKGSFATRVLEMFSRFSLRRADAVVVLDYFMRDRVVAKGIPSERVRIIAPWSHDDAIHFDGAGRQRFRAQHGLSDKFVIMYSGNHSPCHPLDTLLGAAKSMADEPRFVFCFVGGGSEFAKVQRFAAENSLQNILCIPYQPLAELSGSLSAADLHVVVMGDPFVGTIHPCKIYNVLTVGAPVLYVGPRPSHITDIFGELPDSLAHQSVSHGDVAGAVKSIRMIASLPPRTAAAKSQSIAARFSQSALLPEFLRVCVNDQTR